MVLPHLAVCLEKLLREHLVLHGNLQQRRVAGFQGGLWRGCCAHLIAAVKGVAARKATRLCLRRNQVRLEHGSHCMRRVPRTTVLLLPLLPLLHLMKLLTPMLTVMLVLLVMLVVLPVKHLLLLLLLVARRKLSFCLRVVQRLLQQQLTCRDRMVMPAAILSA